MRKIYCEKDQKIKRVRDKEKEINKERERGEGERMP